MTAQLTALERDLLTCVERLVTACETSAKELSALEARSTSRMQSQIDNIAACVMLLIDSQHASANAWQDLLNEVANYTELDMKLQESLAAVKTAEKRLRKG